MSTNLYEALGLDRNASPEEIRKAYRKRALQTHPDRLPPTATAGDKKAAEEQFRRVNNAYEVLNDEQNRKLYDQYGVWPPPATQPEPQRTSNGFRQDPLDAFQSDPFFSSSFGRRSFTFTDPFELFNSLFGDIHRQFFDSDPFFPDPFPSPFSHGSMFDSRRDLPFDHMGMGDPFGMFGGSLIGPSSRSLLGGSMFPELADTGNGVHRRVYSSSTQAIGQNGQWMSQNVMTRTINGRTERITKRRDVQGNEHITYSSPEGERYTINGVEQPRHIANAPPQPQQQTRPPPQAIAAPPPPPPASQYIQPTNSYSAQAQPQAYPAYTQPLATPTANRYSTSGPGSYTYPVQPQPPVMPDPVPSQSSSRKVSLDGRHRDMYRHSNGHDTASVHSHHSRRSSHRDRDGMREREARRDSTSPKQTYSHHSHHAHRERPEYDNVRDADKARRGGWFNELTRKVGNIVKSLKHPFHGHHHDHQGRRASVNVTT